MSRGTLTWACGTAWIVLLALVLIPGLVLAKKPVKPPPDDSTVVNPALAYAVDGKLYIVTADGTQSRELAGGRTSVADYATWLPDGSRIAFTLNGNYGTIEPDGTDLKTTQYAVDGPFTSLTDQFILYFCDTSATPKIMDVGTGITQTLNLGQFLPEDEAASWSFAATPDLDLDTDGYEGCVAFVSMATSLGQTLDPALHMVQLTVSVGGTVSFTATSHKKLDLEYHLSYPAISRDGTTIAAKMDRAIYLISVDLTTPAFGTPVKLYDGEETERYLAVSPTGDLVAWSYQTSRNKSSIDRIRFDGTRQATVTTISTKSYFRLSWNPVWEDDLK